MSWLAELDSGLPPPSRRLIDFLDSCADIGVSWSLNKVLLARMKVATDTIEFMAVRPDGLVEIPWTIGGRKEQFRHFADKLVAGIPGAISYETPKPWIVQRSREECLSVLDLLDNLPAVRAACETLVIW
jgi:hypothetical protein